MTLGFPPQFDPFHEVMVATTQHIGRIADNSVQLAEMRAELTALGRNAPEDQATKVLDTIEFLIATETPPGTGGLEHTFTPGMYGRTIYMPKDSLLTSQVHDTEHQFVILSGTVAVWTRETGTLVFKGPYCGITKPGTRRLLYTFEDTVWKTFHANHDNLTDLDEILGRIVHQHINPLLLQ